MSIGVGTQLGSVEITALLGKGGMGEVYRARDRKLKREVAIKILPEEFSHDADRVTRFQREAEVLASLNHPSIAAIYDLEEANGWRFLVLELVEGETLADRIARGPIPVEEALDLGKQICEALEAAHERGVIHRDLKPGNVKITADGKVKVLDFGLAKLVANESSSVNLRSSLGEGEGWGKSNSPTLATNVGIILGTAAYMSPEQAKGRTVDRRTDIFAFGCVLYEMLTGRAAFEGEDATDIIGRVISAEPDWNRLPADTPVSVRRLLRRALKKDPRQRLGDMRDARLDIEELDIDARDSIAATASQKRPVAWIISMAAAAALLIASGIPAVRHLQEVPPPEMRLQITTPSSPAFNFALSPNGKYLAFVAGAVGNQHLWLRPLDKVAAQPIAGTDGAEYPFWSPDSRSIGFFASGRMYRVDITGGQPQAITNVGGPLGGAWNSDGTIIFAANPVGPLKRVNASGGEATVVTHLGPEQAAHRWPQFLPDHRHFLMYVTGTTGVQGVYLGSLDSSDVKRLASADTGAAYLDPDRIAFVRDNALVAYSIDVAKGELTGDPVTIADSVGRNAAFNQGAFSIAGNRIAYRTGDPSRELMWFDRSGKPVGTAAEPDATLFSNPELSPDGQRLAIQRVVQSDPDIWIKDLVRGSFGKFTSDPSNDNYPVWSPNGQRIVFRSDRKGPYLYVKAASGTGSETLLLDGDAIKVPQDWSRDGRFILYYEVDPKTGRDLWVFDTKEQKPHVFLNTQFEETIAQFSPDGQFVAYQTNEAGDAEIFVQPFPQPTEKWQVSTNGGMQPRWSADGKELYFISTDNKLMAVPITQKGSKLELGTPSALFTTRILTGATGTINRPQYAVSPDGRFLINETVEDSAVSPITLILNWHPGGK